jgi:hypothetical protein
VSMLAMTGLRRFKGRARIAKNDEHTILIPN